MTDDEFTKFKGFQKEVLTKGLPMGVLGEKAVDGLDQILNNYYTVEVKNEYDNTVSFKQVLGSELEKEELEEKVSDLKEKATKYANIMMKLKEGAKNTKEVKKVE